MNTCLSLQPSTPIVANEKSASLYFTKRKICKLSAAVLYYLNESCYKHELPVVNEYLTAIRKLDYDTLLVFDSFGDDVHQRVSNIREFRQAQTFGFSSYSFNEYGWLEKYQFANNHTVSLKVKGDNYYYNQIEIAQAPNGTWVYGYTLTCGGSGKSSGVSIWNTPFPTKEECLIDALNYFKSHFEVAITKKDPSNYNIAYCKQVLTLVLNKLDEAIGIKRNKKGQLAMF